MDQDAPSAGELRGGSDDRILWPAMERREAREGGRGGEATLDSQRMPDLQRHLLNGVGVLALGKLLIGEIQYHEDDDSGSEYLHRRPPNRLPPIKRQRLFELGHC